MGKDIFNVDIDFEYYLEVLKGHRIFVAPVGDTYPREEEFKLEFKFRFKVNNLPENVSLEDIQQFESVVWIITGIREVIVISSPNYLEIEFRESVEDNSTSTAFFKGLDIERLKDLSAGIKSYIEANVSFWTSQLESYNEMEKGFLESSPLSSKTIEGLIMLFEEYVVSLDYDEGDLVAQLEKLYDAVSFELENVEIEDK